MHTTLPVATLLLVAANLASSLLSPNAYADGPGLRPYLGAGIGLTRLEPDVSEIPETVTDENSTAFSVLLGLDINDRITAQLSYTDLGEAELSNGDDFSYTEFSADVLVYGFANKQRREHRFGLLPYGRLGLAVMDNESDIPFKRENDVSLAFGAGLEYGSRSSLAARVEVTSFEEDVLHAGVSLLYRFGGHSSHSAPQLDAAKPLPEPFPAPQLDAAKPLPEPLPDPQSVAKTHNFEPVLFATNSALLDATARQQVARIASVLRDHPEHKVLINGYTDTRASRPYNAALSQQRADAVMQELARLGVNVEDTTSKGLGETDKFGSMDTAHGRQQNRRVDVIAKPTDSPFI